MDALDTHLHLWDPARVSYPWLEGERVLGTRHGPEEVVAAAGDLGLPARGAVIVEADAADPAAELAWLSEVADTTALLVRGIVAALDLEQPDAAQRAADLRAHPRVVGVRHLLQDLPPRRILSPELRAGLLALREAGLPFDACVRAHQLTMLADLLRDLPGLVVVLDHLGKPPLRATRTDPAALSAWHRDLATVADLPGVVVKLSGLRPEAHPDADFTEQAMPALLAALDLFGPDRAMVGSDWPVSARHAPDGTPDSSAEPITLVLDELTRTAGLSQGDRDLLAWRTAEAIYALPSVTVNQ